MRLKKAIWYIQLTLLFQSRVARTPFHLQEAASAYYLMRCRPARTVRKQTCWAVLSTRRRSISFPITSAGFIFPKRLNFIK